MPRTTTNTDCAGIKVRALLLSPSLDTWFGTSSIRMRFMSLGDTHGMSPSQYSGLPLSGVAPPANRTNRPSGFTSQCSGTSPSHLMPEGLSLGSGSRPAARAASGGRPRVTAREISAVRFSLSRSINVRFFATSVSSLEVSRWRKSAIARCSGRGGTGESMRPTIIGFRFNMVVPTAFNDSTSLKPAPENTARMYRGSLLCRRTTSAPVPHSQPSSCRPTTAQRPISPRRPTMTSCCLSRCLSRRKAVASSTLLRISGRIEPATMWAGFTTGIPSWTYSDAWS